MTPPPFDWVVFDTNDALAHTLGMEIQITVNEESGRRAAERAEAVGISLQQAMAAYVQRIADGTELLENDLLPYGTPMQRTLRQQIYRIGA